MKSSFSSITLSIAAALLLATPLVSCNNTGTEGQTETTDSLQTAPMSIEPVTNSPDFPNASLAIESITAKPKGDDSAEVTIKYKVNNYELKGQTHDAHGKGCANSDDGQHIHFILNNQPYVALYKPENTFTVPISQPQYLMSFLSRSYHESVKAPKAGILAYFEIQKDGSVKELPLPTDPMIFYSRPKGEYSGKDVEKVLLDFYVYNTTLGKNTLVKATVNDTSFVVSDWKAFFIENAPLGDLNISLQLTDTAGNPIQGDNTSISRTVQLKK